MTWVRVGLGLVVRDGIGYGLTWVRVGVGYELARYEVVWVRVNWKAW